MQIFQNHTHKTKKKAAILRGSGSDIQIITGAMKRYAASKDKDIHKLLQYAAQLHVKSKVQRYMEVLL